jgi:pimeloyl-ACP methyl ester carboxylesterase
MTLVLIMILLTVHVHSLLQLKCCIHRRHSMAFHRLALFAMDSDNIPRFRDTRFASPLLEEGYRPVVETLENNTLYEKPLLIYLPGFDGTWMAPFLQMPELSTTFDVHCLTMSMQDRSTYLDLKENVIAFIDLQVLDNNRKLEEETGNISDKTLQTPEQGTNFFTVFWAKTAPQRPKETKRTKRPVYLIGESFGGILASDVALSLLKDKAINLMGLVMINAATCYDRSKLASMGPSVAELPEWLYPIGLARLLPLFNDDVSFSQLLLILLSKALPSVIDSEAREAFMGRVAFSLPQKLKYMPQKTLQWRLREWLETGCAEMATKLGQFSDFPSFRTLIIAGEKDFCLPSIDEAERLSSILPNNHIHVVEGAGHATTCGSRVDLAALMRKQFSDLGRVGRTAMKPEAAAGAGVMLGLEPRYNGREKGLSPLLYWSRKLYRKPRPIDLK